LRYPAPVERQAYLALADSLLERVARWGDTFDPDELEATGVDGVVTLEFKDRARFVLNRQTATSQMWFAAGARAWHYDWNAAERAWRDDKDGHELLARLGEVVGAKLGRPIPPI
jgi:CyaY protein